MKTISGAIIVCAGVWLFPQGFGDIHDMKTVLGLGLVTVGLLGWVVSIFRAD